MALQPGTNRQVPDHSIMDAYNKQTYLGNQYVYAVGSTQVITTSETPFLLLSNPTAPGSAFPNGYISLFTNLTKLLCLTASQNATFRLYQNPTITLNGSPLTQTNLRPSSTNTSVAKIYGAPTVTANGVLVGVLAATPGLPDVSTLMSILDPGQNLLITVQTSSNTTFIAAELAWYEL